MEKITNNIYYECIEVYNDHDLLQSLTKYMFSGFTRFATFNFFKEELPYYGDVIIPECDKLKLVVNIPDEFLLYVNILTLFDRLKTRTPYPIRLVYTTSAPHYYIKKGVRND